LCKFSTGGEPSPEFLVGRLEIDVANNQTVLLNKVPKMFAVSIEFVFKREFAFEFGIEVTTNQ